MRPVVRSSESGFSLLEVIIAGAIMAFFAMVMLQVNEIQSRMVVTNEAQMETFTLLFQVQQVLADPVSCSVSVGQAFGRVTDLRDLGGRPAAKIPTLFRAYRNSLGKYEAVKFLSAGQTIGNGILRVNSISVQPRTIFDGQLDFVLEIERTRKGVFGGAITEKRLPINVDLIGPEHANAFDGIMCLSPAQQMPGTDPGKRIEAALQSLRSGDEGSAADSTEKMHIRNCVAAGGAWNAKERRCGTGAPNDQQLAGLRTACTTSGGVWDEATRRCGTPVR